MWLYGCVSTVEPLNNGHIGDRSLFLCREVFPIPKVVIELTGSQTTLRLTSLVPFWVRLLPLHDHVIGCLLAIITRWMQGIEGEREQAECCSVQSRVVCKSRILAIRKSHTMSSLRVPALKSFNCCLFQCKVVSLRSADCESSIACSTPAQAYLIPFALGVACRPV